MISANFKDGQYAIGGVAKTRAETVVEDAVSWGAFDPNTAIVADTGLVSGMPSFSAEAMTALGTGGYVAVMTYQLTDPEVALNEILIGLYDAPNYNTYEEFTARIVEGQSRAGVTTTSNPAEVLIAEVALYRVAFKFDGVQNGCSLNGSGQATGPGAFVEPPDSIGMSLNNDGIGVVIVERIDFYLPADYANVDLPALSTLP